MLGVFLDTETNGLNARIHRILDLAYKIVDLSSGKLIEEYQTILAQPVDIWEKSDSESLRINGFTWEEICRGKSPESAAEQVIEIFTRHKIKRKDAVFICQNPSFDRAFFAQLIAPETQEILKWPYHWLDLASMYWALAIDRAKQNRRSLPWVTGFSKDQIASHYHLPAERKPHRAMNGVEHLLLCYEAVVGFPNANSACH